MSIRWFASRGPRLGSITLWRADGTTRPRTFDKSDLLQVTEPHGFDNSDRLELFRQLDDTGKADLYIVPSAPITRVKSDVPLGGL